MSTVILAVNEIEIEVENCTWQVAIFNFCDEHVTKGSAYYIMRRYGYINADSDTVQALLKTEKYLRPFLPLICAGIGGDSVTCIQKDGEDSTKTLILTDCAWGDKYNFAGMKIAQGHKAWS
jgi:hypothetical protein